MEQKYIINKNGDKALPITSESAVRDANGNPLASKLGVINDALDNRYTKSETYSKSQLDNLITTPNQKYVTVEADDQTTAATDVLPATGEKDTVYRVGNWDGSAYDVTTYSEYAWDGTAYKFLSKKSQIGEVYDISAANGNDTYTDLNDALTNGGVPSSLRKGGMSVKFIQTSDNKYVRYNYLLEDATTNSKFANVNNWQGITSEVKKDSNDLVESGGVSNAIKPLKEKTRNIRIVELPADEEYIKITKNDGEVIVQIDLNGLIAKKIAANELYILDGETLIPVSFGTSVVTDNISDLSFCDIKGNPIMKIGVDGNIETIAFNSKKIRVPKYYGKTILYVGDSISTANNWHWKGYVEDNYGVKYVRYNAGDSVNVTPAVGGITIRPSALDLTRPINQTGEGAKSIFWRCCNHRLDIYDFDVINLFGGTNDCFNQSLVVGTKDDTPLLDTDINDWSTFDFDSVTWASAYKGCIEMLRRDFPDKELVLCTLLYNGMTNNRNIAVLQVQIAELYGLKIVPWFWSSINSDSYQILCADNVHPKPTAARIMAGFYANIIGF